MDETKNVSKTECSPSLTEASNPSPDATKSLTQTEAWQLPAPGFGGPSDCIPSHIGRYRVIDRLGQGGFGRVYLAHDEDLDRPVAIKVPNPERVTRPVDVDAFLSKPASWPGSTIPISCRCSMWVAPKMDFASSCPSSSRAATWRSGSEILDRPYGIRRQWSPRLPTHCTMPMAEGSSTATSSPPTSSLTHRVTHVSSTSVSPFATKTSAKVAGLDRHSGLHESRASQRRGSPCRWSIRHLQPGGRSLRIVDRSQTVPR